MVKIAYVDSSVLVKHYVESEEGSSQASELITSYKVYVSSIARVEVLSALARKHQMQEASVEDIQRVKDAFLSNGERMGIVEVSDDVIREAQDLVFRIPIKTLDAVHLASSILLRRITELSFPLITADKKLATAAESEGFDVIGVGISSGDP